MLALNEEKTEDGGYRCVWYAFSKRWYAPGWDGDISPPVPEHAATNWVEREVIPQRQPGAGHTRIINRAWLEIKSATSNYIANQAAREKAAAEKAAADKVAKEKAAAEKAAEDKVAKEKAAAVAEKAALGMATQKKKSAKEAAAPNEGVEFNHKPAESVKYSLEQIQTWMKTLEQMAHQYAEEHKADEYSTGGGITTPATPAGLSLSLFTTSPAAPVRASKTTTACVSSGAVSKDKSVKWATHIQPQAYKKLAGPSEVVYDGQGIEHCPSSSLTLREELKAAAAKAPTASGPTTSKTRAFLKTSSPKVGHKDMEETGKGKGKEKEMVQSGKGETFEKGKYDHEWFGGEEDDFSNWI
ncbi:hypothetical protein AC579_8978 [Pseudocercospora musae]|uniref:Uncharacterized protein n=1 Tax=Pseudocercospora musae TaxID=113226 RepID=A0A139HNV4_9PEZI|nr:hypothetical protein AC579_8978 [Pseudocercospora musae]